MDGFLPFFPLKLVVFPGEPLNLHIFEPRYKQLIRECLDEDKTFGIPVFHKNQVLAYGTEMKVTRLVKVYSGGEMDINAVGLRVFRVNSFKNQAEGKPYAGGKVTFLPNEMNHTPAQFRKLKNLAKQLIELIQMHEALDVNEARHSFELAHKMGLSLEQEYDMLQMASECKRQEYMINHLTRALPILRQMELAREKIKMNGHFRHLDPLNF